MKASNYMLGEKPFPTKQSITDHVRQVRSVTPEGAQITDAVVLDLLRKHPNWPEKSRNMAMVSTSLVQPWPHISPSKEIVIITKENEIIDISWKKCLLALSKAEESHSGRPPNYHAQEVRKAARFIIQSDIAKHRQRGMEVDHVYPRTFDWLFADWLSARQIKIVDIELAPIHENAIGRTFADTRLAESWFEHHRKLANLKPVNKEDHKKLPKLRVDWCFYA